MSGYVEYFPSGKLGEIKQKIYSDIIGNEAGLDRKSVLHALDLYAEEFYVEKTMEAFNNQPITIYPKPVNTAKQVALDTALKLFSSYPTRVTFGEEEKTQLMVLTMADEIYQWLIKTDKDA